MALDHVPPTHTKNELAMFYGESDYTQPKLHVKMLYVVDWKLKEKPKWKSTNIKTPCFPVLFQLNANFSLLDSSSCYVMSERENTWQTGLTSIEDTSGVSDYIGSLPRTSRLTLRPERREPICD